MFRRALIWSTSASERVRCCFEGSFHNGGGRAFAVPSARLDAGFKRGEEGAVVRENGVGAEGGVRWIKVNFLSCIS